VACAEDDAGLIADDGGTNAWQPVRVYCSGEGRQVRENQDLVVSTDSERVVGGHTASKRSQPRSVVGWLLLLAKGEAELLLRVSPQKTWANKGKGSIPMATEAGAQMRGRTRDPERILQEFPGRFLVGTRKPSKFHGDIHHA